MRCEKLGGTWSDEACIKYQEAGRQECKGCAQGAKVLEAACIELIEKKAGIPADKKYCRQCGETKPRDQFSSDSKAKDGLRSYCKVCTARLTREYQQKKKNLAPLEPIAEQKPKWKKTRPKRIPTKKRIPNSIPVPVFVSVPTPTEVSGSPLDRQIGGSHYRDYAIQPYEFFLRNNIPHHKAAIIRRILRYDHPTGGGLLDLEKIRHEIDLIIAFEKPRGGEQP